MALRHNPNLWNNTYFDWAADHVVNGTTPKRYYVPATSMQVGNPAATAGSTNTNQDAWFHWNLAGTAITSVNFSLLVPFDWAGTGDFDTTIIWAPVSDMGATSVRFRVTMRELVAGNIATLAGSVDVGVTTPQSILTNILSFQDVATNFVPGAVDRLVRVTIARDGDHAADTFTGGAKVFGAYITYTALALL